MDTITISDIPLRTLIGTYDWEQTTPQRLQLDLCFQTDAASIATTDNIDQAIDYDKVLQQIATFAEAHHFQLIETFADQLARYLLDHFPTTSVTLTVHKPGALKEAKDVAIRVIRGR